MPSLLFHPLVVLAAVFTLTPFFYAAFCPGCWQRLQALPLVMRLVLPSGARYPLHPGVHFDRSLSLAVACSLYLAPGADRPFSSKPLAAAIRSNAVNGRTTSSSACSALLWICAGLSRRGAPGLLPSTKCCCWMQGSIGFHCVRQINDAGFDLRLRCRDLGAGFVWFALYAPLAVALGLALGFLHWHALLPSPGRGLGATCLHLLFYRGARRAILSRLDTEPA